MAEKKKSSATKKNDRPTADPRSPGTTIPAEAPRRGAAAAAQSLDGQGQRAAFEAAMKLFHARNWREARDLFLRATKGPERDVAQRAQLHGAMCDRRLEQAAPVLRTAEEYYNYGVALMNARDVGAAREHLEAALRLAPGSGPIPHAPGGGRAPGGGAGAGGSPGRRAREYEARHRTGPAYPHHCPARRRFGGVGRPAAFRRAA